MAIPVDDMSAVAAEPEPSPRRPTPATVPLSAPLSAPLSGELITWHEGLSVGHAGLDDEHRALFHAVNDIYALRGGADIAAARRAAADIEALLRAHFTAEEALLAAAGFPGLDAHRAEHAALLRQLARVQDRYARRPDWGHGTGFVWSLIDFLLEVTLGHLFKADLDYRDHLRGH